jgi:hypothetical protein
MKVTIWYPRGVLLAVVGGAACWLGIAALAVPAFAKLHKHDRPLVKPDAPFSIEPAPDPREIPARQYLAKQAERLREDLKTYPQFRAQIGSLADDIQVLAGMSVTDPEYAARFAGFHASLVSLWALEGCEAI